MLNTIITHPTSPHLPLLNRILYRPPTLQPPPLSPIRTMQKIQIQIPQPTLLHTLLNLLPRLIIPPILLQLGSEPDIFSLDGGVLFEVFEDRGTDFGFIGVPFCRVDGAVSGCEGVRYGIGGFAPRSHVDAEVDSGHEDAIVEFDGAGERHFSCGVGCEVSGFEGSEDGMGHLTRTD